MFNVIDRKSICAAFAVLMLSLCVLFCAGCSQTFTIGTNSNDAVKISAKNETGQSITSLALVSPITQEASEPLEQDGDWDNGSTAELYLDQTIVEIATAGTVEGENGTAEEESDIVLEPLMTIQFTTADGMTYTLHQLNLEDIKDATVKIEDGTAYLVYTSIATGEEVNTLESELAYQAELKAAEEAAQKQAAEQQAAKEKAEQQAKANANKSSSTASSKKSSSSSSSSGGSSSGSASGGEDVCVDDLVLN